MLSLADVLDLPVVRRALPEVVIGDGALGREIRWAHVIEMPDPDDLLKGGELVLTTGLGAGDEARHQAAWTRVADRAGDGGAGGRAGLELARGARRRSSPRARARTFPSSPSTARCASSRSPRRSTARVVNAQFALLARGEEIHRRFTELILQGRGVPEILAELVAAVGNPVVLEDAGGSLVYYVSGPHGDDLALSAWADVHRAEERGESAEGMFAAEVRLLDSSWGRLLALALENPLDDFDRVAVERAALAVAIGLLAQQHDEQLRARSRGAFLSDLADGRVEEGDARRRAEALGLARRQPRRAAADGRDLARAGVRARARPRRGTRPSAGREAPRRRRHHLDAALRRAARRALLDRARGAARPARRRPADPARARRARLRRRAGRARRAPLPRRAGPPRARPGRTRRWRSAGRPTRGSRRGRRCGACGARRARRRRCRSRAGTTRAARASPTSCTTCATRRSSRRSSRSSSARCWPTRSPRSRALLETLEAYLAAGGRKAEAARALHLERQSLYLRLRRIEETLGVSLDDEDVVLGLHLAVRALRFRRGVDGPSGNRRLKRDVPPIAAPRGAGRAWIA